MARVGSTGKPIRNFWRRGIQNPCFDIMYYCRHDVGRRSICSATSIFLFSQWLPLCFLCWVRIGLVYIAYRSELVVLSWLIRSNTLFRRLSRYKQQNSWYKELIWMLTVVLDSKSILNFQTLSFTEVKERSIANSTQIVYTLIRRSESSHSQPKERNQIELRRLLCTNEHIFRARSHRSVEIYKSSNEQKHSHTEIM